MATKPVVQSLKDAAFLDYWNLMVYADPGAGKTVFSGQDNKVLFLAPEGDGLKSAQTMNSGADFVSVKCWEDVKNAYEWYDEHPEELADFNVFVIDSISELQYLAKDYTLRMTEDEKRRKNQDPTKMQIQDYGIMHELLENMVRGFNDLQINVLYTATAKMVADADENNFLVPDLQGKKDYGIALKMAALMTAYGYLRVEVHETPAPTEDDPKATKPVKRRVIYWEDTGTIRGKDRTNALKPFTVNATLQQVRLAIAGKMERATDGRLIKPTVGAPTKAPAKAAPVKPAIVKAQASPQTATNEVESTTALPPNTHDPVTGEVALDAVEA